MVRNLIVVTEGWYLEVDYDVIRYRHILWYKLIRLLNDSFIIVVVIFRVYNVTLRRSYFFLRFLIFILFACDFNWFSCSHESSSRHVIGVNFHVLLVKSAITHNVAFNHWKYWSSVVVILILNWLQCAAVSPGGLREGYLDQHFQLKNTSEPYFFLVTEIRIVEKNKCFFTVEALFPWALTQPHPHPQPVL